MADSKNVDVVIIGGGLAGLAAALKLKDAKKTFVLLESEPRLGGRTLMRFDADGNGYDCEFGGGYVGASQNYIQYLLRRFEIQTFRQYLRKDYDWLFQYSDPARIDHLPGDNPLALPGKRNGQFILGLVDTLALDVRTYLPDAWNHPQAASYDELTVEEWIVDQRKLWEQTGKQDAPGMGPDTEDAFRSAIRCAFSLEPRDISFFFLLYYSACAGSFAALVDVAGGEGAAEGTRLRFGTQNLVDALRGQFAEEEIHEKARVERIVHGPNGAEVCTERGQWHARRVIVAMSPPASRRIRYEPALEHCDGGKARVALCSRMEDCLGRTIKGFVRFRDAFWRKEDRKLMGFLLSAGPYQTCPVSWTLDNVWNPGSKDFQRFQKRPEFEPGGKLAPRFPANTEPHNPTYKLMTFIVGDSAKYWGEKSPQVRAQAVLDHLRAVYGFKDEGLFDADNPLANYQEENWLPRCDQGVPAPAAMMPPRALTKFGAALRQPIGAIHWAGSESAHEWCGYMSGAVESGFRAALATISEL
jgi:monoamine oxidase